MDKTKVQFDKILLDLKKDPNVIGVFLSGSRGKGFETQNFDSWRNLFLWKIVKKA